MKRILSWLLPLAVTAAGCAGDDLDIITDDNNGTETIVTLTDPGLSWPASSYSIVYGDPFSSPVLTNPTGFR